MARRVEEDSGIDTRRLRGLARRLEGAYPEGPWWPFDDPFAVAVSAVLTQQTRWAAVEGAMAALGREGLLAPARLAKAPRAKVERILRPTGFYRQKARAVQGIAKILVDRFGGSLEAALELPTAALRKELLGWPGVGQETADSILLFAADRPAFVVDAYTVRLMKRYGALREGARPSYGALARAWAQAVPGGPAEFRATHASIVEHSKAVCAATPACGRCPIERGCARVGVPD